MKDTIATHCSPTKLSADERTRNSIGKIFGYKFDPTCTDVVPSPSDKIGLADIAESHSSVVIHEENLGLSNLVFEPKLILGTQVPFPGFPSLNVLPIASGELASVGLNCFGFPSKYPNVILTMQEMIELPPIEQLAEIVIGKSLFVNWPMMHEGRVVAVTDANQEVRVVDGLFKIKEHTKLASDRWSQDSEMIAQTYYTGNGVPGSGGIQIGDIKIRLKVLPLQGMRTNAANGSTKKVFGNEEADVPLQLALWQAPVVDPRFIERGPMTLQERFPVDCNVVLTKGKLRGCSGVVVGTADGKNVGVKVMTLPPEIPFGLVIASSVQEAFVSSYDAARVLKINPGVFGKIVGRLPFEQGRYDLGLNLKSADGFCVIGYTRKKPEDHKAKKQGQKGGVWTVGDSVLVVGSRSLSDEALNEERLQWEYTPKAIRLVESYRTQFPQLFYAIGKMPNERKYDAYQVFGDNGEAWLPKVREWLDNDESAKLPRSPVTTESMSYEATAAIQKAADVRSLALKKKGYPQVSLVKVPGSALYREGSTGATDILLPTDINDSDKPQLGERVVNLCADGVPFGARGTVVGIHSAAASGSVELLMDEEFIGGTSLQGHCSNFRGKLCHWSHVLRITPENGKGVVDQLVPVNSKQADVNTILALAAPNKPERSAGSWDAHVDSFAHAAKSLNSTPMRSADRAKSRTPPRSSSRAGSTGRNRLITWKEARGPDEKGLGFKQSTRGGANGLTRWKKIIQARQISQITTAFEVEQTAKDLKRMLGLTSPPSASASTPQGHTAQLKAILGVTPGSNQVPNNTPAVQAPPVADTTTTNVSDGLKAILGVGPTLPPPVHVEPLPPPPPSTAAEQLLQLMAGKMQSQGPPNFFQPVAPSAFNFTYVDAGQEAPPPAAPPPTSHAPPHYFNNNYQNGYFPIMPQYGSVPPPTAHLLSNPAYYGTPAGYGGVAVATRHPIQPSGPSLVEFPPLNGSATAAVDTAAAAVVTVAALSSTDTTNPVLNQQPPVAASLMVPSVVQGRL